MMMGCKSSKAVSGPESSSQGRTDSLFESDLSSYEAACRKDSTLQQFDGTLHRRTNDVIGTLAAGLDVRSLSFDSLKQVIGCLLETNEEAVKIILEPLENCLKRARNNQLIIQLAVRHFDEEAGLRVEDGERKFVKTLEELGKFKAAEEPFTKEFFILFDSVRRQQELMLQKLLARKRNLDKKLKSLKTWRRVSNVLFVATFVSVVIFSVVAAAIAAPPVVAALAAALAPIGTVGKWCNWLWKRYEKDLKEQKELINEMWSRSYFAIHDLENIRVLIRKLEIEMESLLYDADFALREEDALKLAMDEIKRKLEAFMTTIEELGQQADTCSRNIRMARTVVLKKMMNGSGSSSTGASHLEL
ncbi:geranylgeranyl pyrophosphate synthase [Hibiscus syriacus]|uniref:Geranylgeranyl pyrophosphate synthase n=1 Tax=Hibiscus syriacus TaxID=106335 RepID=A0A6A2XAF5_HIBSY|nr:geranylgeranyl pyrophosphate synthase [Hibiscus syriacus]